MKKLLFLFFIFHFSLIASDSLSSSFFHLTEDYPTDFAQCLQHGEIGKGYEILERWSIERPENIPYIMGLYSTLLLAQGKIEESVQLMKETMPSLGRTRMAPEILKMIEDLYSKVEEDMILDVSMLAVSDIFLCKKKQPKGVRFKFWVGVAQIVGGCLTMPFNPAAGLTLIGTGASCVIDATGDALDNKEKWDKDLDDRQHIQPEDFDVPTQNNSFYDSRYSGIELYAC